MKVMAMMILIAIPNIKNPDRVLASSFSICFLPGLLCASDVTCFVFAALSSLTEVFDRAPVIIIVGGSEYAGTGESDPATASPVNIVSDMKCRR